MPSREELERMLGALISFGRMYEVAEVRGVVSSEK
jgi:hypothetical protein